MAANEPINVFLIEPSAKILTRLKEQFAGLEQFRLVGTSSRGAHAFAVIQDLRDGIDVVIVDLDAPDGLATVRNLAGIVPAIIGASIPGLPKSQLDEATAAGVIRHTTKPFSAKELLADIHEAHRRAKGGQSELSSEKADTQIGRLVLVIAAKGGVGTSMVALNLAVGFRQALTQNVALIDGDFQFGDLALLANALHGPNIADLFDGHRQWHSQDLPTAFRKGPAEIGLLAAPENPLHADLITTERFSSLLSDFRRLNSVVIIDLPSHLTDIALGALERADDIVVISDMTNSSLVNTQHLQKLFTGLSIDPNKIHLVLNDARPPAQLGREAAEVILEHPAQIFLPAETKTVQAATKSGIPILLSNHKTPLTSALKELATQILARDPSDHNLSKPQVEKPAKRRGLFRGHGK